MRISTLSVLTFLLSLVLLPAAWAQNEDKPAETGKATAEQQKLLEEAEAVRLEAQRSVEEAHLAAQAGKEAARQAQEMERLREELSRAHKQLREVSRQVAQAHREIEEIEKVNAIEPGGRAVLGVILGKENEEGVTIIGVSPDGPAERAGLQPGDVLISLADVELAAQSGGARNALFKVMRDVRPGDTLPAEVSRDGKTMKVGVVTEPREAGGWQTIVRLPEPPTVAQAPHVVVKKIQIPEIDEAELASRIEEINRQLQNVELRFSGEDGESIAFDHEFNFDGESFSSIGEQAMRDADFWFGLPQARGLELARLNPELGKYFKADRGVLIIEARPDNAYGLESGDVIQTVNAVEVNAPADLLRVLRDVDPGSEIELSIKRDRRDRKLQATVPENRLGSIHVRHLKTPAPPAPPSKSAAAD